MRYQSTLGFSEFALNEEFKMLIEHIPNRKKKHDFTVSIAYFDFKQRNISVEIYDFLLKRAQCKFPPMLTDTIDVSFNIFYYLSNCRNFNLFLYFYSRNSKQ